MVVTRRRKSTAFEEPPTRTADSTSKSLPKKSNTKRRESSASRNQSDHNLASASDSKGASKPIETQNQNSSNAKHQAVVNNSDDSDGDFELQKHSETKSKGSPRQKQKTSRHSSPDENDSKKNCPKKRSTEQTELHTPQSVSIVEALINKSDDSSADFEPQIHAETKKGTRNLRQKRKASQQSVPGQSDAKKNGQKKRATKQIESDSSDSDSGNLSETKNIKGKLKTPKDGECESDLKKTGPKKSSSKQLKSKNQKSETIALTRLTNSDESDHDFEQCKTIKAKNEPKPATKRGVKPAARDIGKSECKKQCFDSTKNSLTETVENIVKTKNIQHQALKSNEDDSSSESEWEEVAEDKLEMDLDDYNPEIPKEGVDITIKDPFMKKKKQKYQYDAINDARMQVNRFKKDVQVALHKVHLLCLVACGLHLNRILNCDIICGIAFSLIPSYIQISKGIDETQLLKLTKWYQQEFMLILEEDEKLHSPSMEERLLSVAQTRKALSVRDYCLMFVSICRALGIEVRFCTAVNPIPFKASNLIAKKRKVECIDLSDNDESVAAIPKKEETKPVLKKTPKRKKQKSNSRESKARGKLKKKEKKHMKSSSSSESEDAEENGSRRSLQRRSSRKVSYKDGSSDNEVLDDSDEDFEKNHSEDSTEIKKATTSRAAKPKMKPPKTKLRLISSDSDNSNKLSAHVDYWAEVYLSDKKKWVCVECIHNIVNKPHKVEKNTSQPVSYILSFTKGGEVKDVTWRYASGWLTVVRKLRLTEWWEETLELFAPLNDAKDQEEMREFQATMMEKPLPKTIGEFKDHPLYVLKRHLLKFQGLYPPDSPPLGFIRGEAAYARECVHKLHSRETWLKEARSVKIGEQPYKIVKANPKWDKMELKFRCDLPLEIFGEWQTEKYEPPTAKDGKVPRNEYGNVNLFQPEMLPKGTVHLQLSGLNRVARKLGIDCVHAVVGFELRGHGSGPMFDGWIVCEEYQETLMLAWEEEQVNIRKREQEKRENRIYGNWKRLIKGLLIREKIKAKYLNNEPGGSKS